MLYLNQNQIEMTRRNSLGWRQNVEASDDFASALAVALAEPAASDSIATRGYLAGNRIMVEDHLIARWVESGHASMPILPVEMARFPRLLRVVMQ